MPTFDTLIGRELVWRQHGMFRQSYELSVGDELLATLAWKKRGNVLGQWGAEGYWFSQKGWWRPRTFVRLAVGDEFPEDHAPVAVFASQGNGGTLTFTDGLAFSWQKPRFWTNAHTWSANGADLLRFQPSTWGGKVTLTLEPAAASQPVIPLLALLGEYLYVREVQNTTVAVTTATTVATGA